MNDLRFAFRQLLKNPGFTDVAVLTLALGIGAGAAIFSVTNTVLLRQLPYRDPERLVVVSEQNLAKGGEQSVASTASFLDWRQQCTAFMGLASVVSANFNLSGIGTPERLQAGMVTGNFFEVLGVRPLLGRTFLPEEEESGKHFVVILSEGLWQRRFGGDANVIGGQVTLNGNVHTIVGVLPRGFRFLQPAGLAGWPAGQAEPEVWRPYPYSSIDAQNRDYRWLLVSGRLKPGIAASGAEAELRSIAIRIAQSAPSAIGWSVTVKRLHEQITWRFQTWLLILVAAVGTILLIACVNAANLLLARALTREKEFAIRLALGASRASLVCQLLAESLLLALLAGGVGVCCARAGVALLPALAPGEMWQWGEVHVDYRVLGFALFVSLATGVLFGLVPALQAFKTPVIESLKDASRGVSESPRRQGARQLLVVTELALALVLMIVAGLLTRSFYELCRVDPGFQPDHLLAIDVSLADRNFGDPNIRIRYARLLRERVALLPGIVSAATVYGLPFGSMVKDQHPLTIEGRASELPGRANLAAFRQVSPGYFETMGISVLTGRAFNNADDTNARRVAVINEALARQFFSGEDPLGRSVKIADDPQPHEIVGVIRDIRPQGLDTPPAPEIYQCQLQACEWYVSLVARTVGDPSRLLESVRKEALSVDPEKALYNVRTLDRQIAQSITPQRFTMLLIGLFAGTALVLAAIGIYGVMAYSATQRTREIGIRMALGAQRHNVYRLVIGQGIKLVLAGIATGLLAALALTRWLASLLYGVSPTDTLTLAMVSLALTFIALVACWIPARRASKVDPMEALRCE